MSSKSYFRREVETMMSTNKLQFNLLWTHISCDKMIEVVNVYLHNLSSSISLPSSLKTSDASFFLLAMHWIHRLCEHVNISMKIEEHGSHFQMTQKPNQRSQGFTHFQDASSCISTLSIADNHTQACALCHLGTRKRTCRRYTGKRRQLTSCSRRGCLQLCTRRPSYRWG